MKYWLVIALFVVVLLLIPRKEEARQEGDLSWWSVQSVDTMKFSRDLAREKLTDSSFDQIIEIQVKNISMTGATHVAVATPYDAEFLPFLHRWVASARKHNLKVWFRGNWSGWENWFGYPDISRSDHLTKTKEFILSNGTLFESGDIFTSCPECENGGPGDPRITRDISGYRLFLIDLYKTSSEAFSQINKNVTTNYFSSNGDVAKLIWDASTTSALGGIVVIDHYVATPEKLVSDIKSLAASSGGRVVLGEFGAPIPDIHGIMTEYQQQAWISEALERLAEIPELVGLNYWTSAGSSASLWSAEGTPREAVASLTTAYSPRILSLKVKNQAGGSIKTARAELSGRTYIADTNGLIRVPLISGSHQITLTSSDYFSHGLIVTQDTSDLDIILTKTHENWLFKLQKLTYRLISSILP